MAFSRVGSYAFTFETTLNALNQLNKLGYAKTLKKKALIIGYGYVGKAVAHTLRSKGVKEILVADVDAMCAYQAMMDGHTSVAIHEPIITKEAKSRDQLASASFIEVHKKTSIHTEIFKNVDLVITTTGVKNIIDHQIINHLKPDATLMNMSDELKEINFSTIQRKYESTEVQPHIWQIKVLKQKTGYYDHDLDDDESHNVYLIGSGLPFNHVFCDMWPTKHLDLMLATYGQCLCDVAHHPINDNLHSDNEIFYKNYDLDNYLAEAILSHHSSMA